MCKTITIEFTGGSHGYNSTTVRAKVIDNGSYLGGVHQCRPGQKA